MLSLGPIILLPKLSMEEVLEERTTSGVGGIPIPSVVRVRVLILGVGWHYVEIRTNGVVDGYFELVLDVVVIWEEIDEGFVCCHTEITD